MNLTKIRKDTRFCTDKLFFNSAGSSLPPSIVVDTMKKTIDEVEQYGGYEVEKMRTPDLQEFYVETAKLLNCKPQNVAFTFNATDSYARALSSIPFKENDVILTTDNEYGSNHFAFLSLQKRFKIKFIRAGNLENGDLDLEEVERLMKKHRPKLMALTHIPTNSGLIQDAVGVGALCRKYEIMYLLDACQSVGQMPVDVQKIGCDFLSATGRKFLRGPRGTGLLYVADRILEKKLEPMFIDSHGASWVATNTYEPKKIAQLFEMWEASTPTRLGLTEAVRYANQIGMDQIFEYNQQLIGFLREKLAATPYIQMYDKGSQRCSILTFRKKGVDQPTMEQKLREAKVYFSIAQTYSARIDFEKKGIEWAVRLSPHYFNTREEVEQVVEIIDKI